MSVAKIKKCLGELERQPNSKQWIQSLGDVAWVRMKSSLIADMRAENLAGRGDVNGALGLIDRYSTNVKDDLKALYEALTKQEPKSKQESKQKPAKKSAVPELFAGSKHRKTYDLVSGILNDMVPAFGNLFNGVELYEDSDQRTGGFAFNNKTGKLMVILADINAALKDVKDVEKWVGAALVEEAIHSSTRRLEKQGKFNGKELLRVIRRDAKHVYDKIREAYKTGSDEAAADEFIRMLVQGRVKFNVGSNSIEINGELTEMQYTPGALGVLKKVLEQLLGIIRNLKQKLPAHLAERLDEIKSMIEEDIRATTEKPQETRPADEEFVWTAEDNMSGTQPISQQMDADYLAAVERGDMETAQKMVNDAAKKVGYHLGPVYHGSKTQGIREFGHPTFFARSKGLAGMYSEDYKNGSIGEVYTANIKPGKTLKLWQFRNWVDVTNMLEKQYGKRAADEIRGLVLKNLYNDQFAGFHESVKTVGDSKALDEFVKTQRTWENYEKHVSDRLKKDKDADFWDTEGMDLSSTWGKYNPSDSNFANQRDLVEALFSLGYDTLSQLESGSNPNQDASYVVKSPNQIKSADPVTRDAEGNVIPLSQRFNSESNDIRYSQPISGRSQELGVKNLGEERPVESIRLIEQAVKDTIFDADTKRLDDPDDYQEARDLAISLTTGQAGDVLRGLKDRIADLPELADVPKNLDALSALVYKQLIRYAVRLITDGTGGRNADFSLFKTLLDNYGNLPLAAMEDAVNYDDGTAKATTRISRIMRSLKEATEPMGLFFKYYGERQVDAKKAMLEQGMTEDQIQALSDFINNIKPDEDFKNDVGDELESKKDELNRLQAKIDALMKQLAGLKGEAKEKKRKEIEAKKAKSEEQKIADETRRLMAKYATPDTWTNESPKAKSDLENLVNQHLRAPVVNFVEQATALGVPEEQAILLEKQVTSARDARAVAAEYRRNNPSEKAKQAAIDAIMKKIGPSVKPEGKKPRVVDTIMEAMMEHPEQISDPAWRKGVIEGWLEAQGIDPADFPVGKMDALIAGMFANAQGKALQRFYGKRDAEGKLIKRQKVQPTELQKITNAIKVGMITGAPVEWQTAFTEKTGMKPLTPDEMRDVLRYSEMVNNENGEFLRQDQVHALGKLSTIFRRAGARPSFLSYLAASYTTSALTGLATQSMQVHAAASNWMARIYEDLATGQGVMPVMNAIRLAVDSYKRTFASAWVNDSYREQQLDEVAKLSALKTLLEDKIAKFQSSKGAARIAQIPGIFVGLQDFFRRFMSSADDAAVAGLKAYIQSVEGQSILRGSGIDQKTINGLFDVAREEMETLSNEESRVANRPQFNEKEYRAWVVDKVTSNLRKSMSELLMAKGKSESDVKQMLADIDSYSEHEAEADVGVGKLRDSGSRLDPIQKFGEWIVSGVEKALRLNPKDTDPDAALKYIGARMLFGFVRTPFSVMSRAVYRGPLGLWRLAITGAIMPGKTSERASKMYARTMGTARQQAQRRKEALVWTLTMTALHLLARGLSKDDDENDPIVINGQGPEDPQAKAAWKAAGHVANAIELNIGGEKISIPFGRSGLENIKPALMMLGTLDDMHQNGMSKGTPENLWTYAKSYGANTIYTANLFGFRNIANWRQDTSSENALVKRALYSFSPLIPFSGMVKSIGKTIRPDKPDDKTFKGAIALSTPVFWIGEDAYNMYGDKVYGTPSSTHGDVTNRLMYAIGLPFSIDSQKDEAAMKAYQFSLKTGLAPSSPDRTDVDRRLKRENKITEPMTDEQWVRYQKAAGKTRMEAMKEFAPRAEGMSTEAINRNLNVVNRRAERAGEAAIK